MNEFETAFIIIVICGSMFCAGILAHIIYTLGKGVDKGK